MTAVAESPQKPEQHPRKAPKIRAVLAGGLVLGIGAAVTLAAWNDSEFAQGTFTAGTFNLEGSTDGAAYSSNADPASPKQLAFTTSTANMSPGDVVSAPFAVRLDAATSYDTTVALSTPTPAPVAGLTYTVTRTNTFGCGGTVLDTLVLPGQEVGTTPAGVTFPLTQGTGNDPGTPFYLCFQVTAGSDLVQGATNTAVWEFAAQS